MSQDEDNSLELRFSEPESGELTPEPEDTLTPPPSILEPLPPITADEAPLGDSSPVLDSCPSFILEVSQDIEEVPPILRVTIATVEEFDGVGSEPGAVPTDPEIFSEPSTEPEDLSEFATTEELGNLSDSTPDDPLLPSDSSPETPAILSDLNPPDESMPSLMQTQFHIPNTSLSADEVSLSRLDNDEPLETIEESSVVLQPSPKEEISVSEPASLQLLKSGRPSLLTPSDKVDNSTNLSRFADSDNPIINPTTANTEPEPVSPLVSEPLTQPCNVELSKNIEADMVIKCNQGSTDFVSEKSGAFINKPAHAEEIVDLDSHSSLEMKITAYSPPLLPRPESVRSTGTMDTEIDVEAQDDFELDPMLSSSSLTNSPLASPSHGAILQTQTDEPIEPELSSLPSAIPTPATTVERDTVPLPLAVKRIASAAPDLLPNGHLKRRSPGRPKRRRIEEEGSYSEDLRTSNLRESTQLQSNTETPSRTGDSSTSSKLLPRRTSSRNQFTLSNPSPSPPPSSSRVTSSNSTRRRGTVSSTSQTRSSNSTGRSFESAASPGPAISPVDSPIPSDQINSHNMTDEQVKQMQKEAVTMLKRLETDFTKLKAQIYQEKLQELTRDVTTIQDGTSALLHARACEAKERRLKRLQTARRQREYALWEATCQLAAQQFTLDTQFLSDRHTLRRRLHDRILKDRWRVEEARILAEMNQEAPSPPATKLLLEREEGKPLTFEDQITGLDEETIDADLALMRGNRPPPTNNSSSSPPESKLHYSMGRYSHPLEDEDYRPHIHSAVLPVAPEWPHSISTPISIWAPNQTDNDIPSPTRVEVQALGTEDLLLGNDIHRVGDRVVAVDLSQATTFHARLAGVGPDEIMLQQSDGTRTRVHFSLLARGQYQLTPVPNSSPFPALQPIDSLSSLTQQQHHHQHVRPWK